MGLKKYSLSGFCRHGEVLRFLLLAVAEKDPHIFRKDIIIESVFGSFPNVIWNGARMFLDFPLSKSEMSKIIDSYNSNGVGIYFTYNNSQLEKKHMGDYLANMTLELAYNKMNGVIVNSPVLEEHIKTNFPDFKLIGSCTAANWGKDWLRQRSKEVDLLVIPPEYNADYEFIKSIGPEKVEILVSETCLLFCPQKRWHYDNTAKAILEFDAQKDQYGFDKCVVMEDFVLTEWGRNNPGKLLQPTKQEEIDKLSDIGVRHFKLPGRGKSVVEYIAALTNILIVDDKAKVHFLNIVHNMLDLAKRMENRK